MLCKTLKKIKLMETIFDIIWLKIDKFCQYKMNLNSGSGFKSTLGYIDFQSNEPNLVLQKSTGLGIVQELKINMEQETGIEPAAITLATWRSTN